MAVKQALNTINDLCVEKNGICYQYMWIFEALYTSSLCGYQCYQPMNWYTIDNIITLYIGYNMVIIIQLVTL